MSVIFKSDGAEDFGVRSIAFSKPVAKLLNGAMGAKAAATAALDKNDLLDVGLVIFDFFLCVTSFGLSGIPVSLLLVQEVH